MKLGQLFQFVGAFSIIVLCAHNAQANSICNLDRQTGHSVHPHGAYVEVTTDLQPQLIIQKPTHMPYPQYVRADILACERIFIRLPAEGASQPRMHCKSAQSSAMLYDGYVEVHTSLLDREHLVLSCQPAI